MSFSLPALPAVGTVATVANWATPVRNSLKALRGIDGAEIFLSAGEGNTNLSAHAYYELYATLLFSSSGTQKAEFSMKVPDNFSTLTSVKAVWLSAATSGNMYWQFAADYAAVGEIGNTHTTSPGYAATATAGAYKWNVQEAGLPLALAGLAIGDYLGVEITRDSTHASDTLTTKPVYLLGLLFSYAASS